MEADVGGADALPVVARRGLLGVEHGLLEQRQRRLGRSPPHGRALQHAAHLVEVGDVLGGRQPDEHAPVEPVVEQPLVAEQPERLAQRVARHLQRLRDGLLGQPLTGLEVALADAAAQDVGHPLGRAAAPQPRPVLGEIGNHVIHI